MSARRRIVKFEIFKGDLKFSWMVRMKEIIGKHPGFLCYSQTGDAHSSWAPVPTVSLIGVRRCSIWCSIVSAVEIVVRIFYISFVSHLCLCHVELVKSSREEFDRQQNAPETGRQRMGTSTTAPPRPQRFDPLGINFDRPRYPAYAVLTVRNGSYSDWPTSLTQEPLDMALAGFFYAGYGDYVRCFFCGGGLRNWDDGDDPWVEHAKWFPRCAFVRQNKGEKFVNDIQRRHHEQGAGIEFEEEIEEQIPDEELPAYRSLIEMNYSPETVQRAIETFRQRIRPVSGRQVPLPMSATNLADIIFEFENGNSNSKIADVSQSEGEEVERTTEGVRSGSHATEGIRTEPPATEGVKTSSPATEDVRIESPSETIPSDVAESGRISEEERRAEQTKLLEEASAFESTSSQEGEGDFETLKEENISLKEKLKCKVCLEKDVAVAFLPCGHLVCCTDCAPAIRICLICNEMVKGTVKTFFP